MKPGIGFNLIRPPINPLRQSITYLASKNVSLPVSKTEEYFHLSLRILSLFSIKGNAMKKHTPNIRGVLLFAFMLDSI
ncbi:hypothetical protein CVD19_07715 [Bacillus sp. T33-2]|nr:hypothetical protein CVD19_07715 [Bacillus sp. T33-2]